MYVAMFSYEQEDSKLQSALEAWWVNLSDIEASLWARVQKFAMKSCDVTDSFLSRWLGDETESRSISTSIVLSVSSVLLLGSNILPFPWSLLMVAVGALWLRQAFLPMRTGRPPLIAASIAAAMCLLPLLLPLYPSYQDDWHFVLAGALAFSLLASNFAIKIVRSLIKRFKSKPAPLFMIALPLIVTGAVIFLSMASIMFLGPFSWILVPVMTLPALAMSFLPLLLPVLLAALTVLTRLFGKGLYSVQRHKIVYNKKILWGLSVAQLGAVPISNSLMSYFTG